MLIAIIVIGLTSSSALSQPQVIWSQTYGGRDTDECLAMTATDDGGFALAGETRSFGEGGWDAYLVKADADGEQVWQQTYGDDATDQAYCIATTADGGYIVGGTSSGLGNGAFDFYLIKTDGDGEMEWWRSGYGRGGYDHCQSVFQTPDGGYSMAGKLDGNRWDMHLIQTDERGDQTWAHSYHRQWSENAYDHLMTEDGGFILAGFANLPDQDIWDVYVVRTDDEGNQVWARSYGGDASELCLSIAETFDGCYTLAGRTNSFGAGDYDFYLIKIDEDGEVIWSRTYGGEGEDACYSVIQVEDGGFVLAGHSSSFGEGGLDCYLVRTDAEGEEQWSLTFGGEGQEYCRTVVCTPDGGYVLGGNTESFGAGGLDMWLVRTSPDPLLGNVEPPVIAVDPIAIDAQGSSEHVINIANNGEGRLWWRAEVDVEWMTCDQLREIVEPGGDTDIFVTLDAEGLAPGAHETEIRILSNDPENSVVVVDVMLRLDDAPVIIVEPEALDFGNTMVGESEDRMLTISNIGNIDLTVFDISAVEGNSFNVDFDEEVIIEPDASREITVSFAPDELGEYEDVLFIISDDPDDEEIEIPLAGIGVDELPQIPGEPLIYWNFNEGEGEVAHDGSGNDLDGAIVSAAWENEGINGNCLYFDGINDYVTLDDNELLTVNEGFMAIAWVYPQYDDQVWHDIMRHHMQSGETEGWVLQTGGNRVLIAMIKMDNNCFHSPEGVGPLPLNAWSKVALAWDGDVGEIWLNGRLELRWETEGDEINSRSDFCVGRLSRDFDRNNHFRGRIDEPAFYTYYDQDVLSAQGEVGPDIVVEPEALDFGNALVDEVAELTLTISNDGEQQLEIENIIVEGEAFRTEWEEEAPQFDWEYEIEEGDGNTSIIVREAIINGEPLIDGDCVGVFNVNDECAGFTQVEERFPIGVAAWEHYFDFWIWEDRVMRFRIWDESSASEYATETEWINGDDHYQNNGLVEVILEAADILRGNGEEEINRIVEPDHEIEVGVFFEPDEARDYAGVLTVLSNDPNDPEVAVELTGAGIDEAPDLRHFTDFVETEVNHSLLILSLSFEDEPAPTGWEVGVFTPGDILAGAGVWIDGQRLGIAAWADDAQTEDTIEGFRGNERFYFRVWDDDTDHEYHAYGEFQAGLDHWAVNGNSALNLSAPERELVVSLREGWNMISINILPSEDMWLDERGPDIELMTEQLRIDEDNHRIIIMKDDQGRFYAPGFGFNDIPYWELTDGYQLKLTEGIDVVWSGELISAVADIPIHRDWNMIAYYPTYDLDASAPDFYVLSTIIDHVIIAKDGHGRFIWPEFEYSDMPPWSETQGYLVKVEDDLVLNYPPEEIEGNLRIRRTGIPACQSVTGKREMTAKDRCPASLVHRNTGSNMSLLITSSDHLSENLAGAELGVFTAKGLCVGSVVLSTTGNGCPAGNRWGLAIWGDDPTTDEQVEGAVEGENLAFKIWDGTSERTISPDFIEGVPVYTKDGFAVISISNVEIPCQFELTSIHPNPFNSTTTIKYSLDRETRISIRIFDLQGREVAVVFEGQRQSGNYRQVFQADNLSSGVYFCRIKDASNRQHIRKMVLVR